MPTVVRQDLDNSSAILTVTVTREELKPKLDSELKKFRQRVPIKGFRAGQVPMDYVKKLYGASIFGDTLNDLLTEELYGYLRDSKLDVLGQPIPTEDQEKFSFKISDPDPEYAVKYEVGFVPKIDLKGLDKKEVFERLTISNTDELALEDLEYSRRRAGTHAPVEDTIQENDMVKVAARELDGDAVKADGFSTTINLHVKSLADDTVRQQLLTMKKGDTLRFNARTLENHEKDEAYRKYILQLEADDTREVGDMFEGVIEEVSRLTAAEMTPEFLSNYFGNADITTEAQAIEEIKKGILGFYDIRSNALLMRSFQERLMEKNQVELPEKFLKRWLKATNQGKLSEASIEREYPAFAENLRWTIIRDDIKAKFNVEVTDEDVVAAFKAKVRSYFGMSAGLPDSLIDSSVERLMQNQEDVDNTRRDLETDKVFEAIRSQVTVEDKAILSDEFHKVVEAVTAKAQAEQEADAEIRAAQ
jgi:trigger factor